MITTHLLRSQPKQASLAHRIEYSPFRELYAGPKAYVGTISEIQGGPTPLGNPFSLSAEKHYKLGQAYMNILVEHQKKLKITTWSNNGWIPLILDEMETVCEEYETFVSQKTQTTTTPEPVRTFVYFSKMIGDFHCIVWSCMKDTNDSGYSRRASPHLEGARAAYARACPAAKNLSPADPLRLDLSHSFAEFSMRVLGEPEQACNLLKIAILDATPYTHGCTEPTQQAFSRLQHKLREWNKECGMDYQHIDYFPH